MEKLNKEKFEKEILRISDQKPEYQKYMEQIELNSPPKFNEARDQRLDRN